MGSGGCSHSWGGSAGSSRRCTGRGLSRDDLDTGGREWPPPIAVDGALRALPQQGYMRLGSRTNCYLKWDHLLLLCNNFYSSLK